MQLSNIKNHSIIIAPTHLHAMIREQLLSQKQAILDVNITSYEHYFQTNVISDSIYQYANRLHAIKEQVHYQKHSLDSFSFIEELIQFVTHLKQFSIPLTALSKQNPVDIELAFIISTVYDCPLTVDAQLQAIHTHHSTKQIYIIDTYATPFQKYVYDLLYAQGALCITHAQKPQTIQYYSALNKRKEVESLAQYIIEHNIQPHQAKISILSNDYQPFIKSIFQFYKIPFRFKKESYIPSLLQKFISLVEYAMQPNQQTLTPLLRGQVFPVAHVLDCLHYMQLFECTMDTPFTHVQANVISYDVINEQEYTHLCSLEQRAETARIAIQPILKQLVSTQNIQDTLSFIDAYLIENHKFEIHSDRTTMLTIRQEMRHAIRHFTQLSQLRLCIDILSNKEVNLSQGQGFFVAHLKEQAFVHPYHFVLGCTQSNYPALPTFNGVFKEEHYNCIPAMLLANRYDLHVQNLEKLLSTSHTLICFYPFSTFDGKGAETSLELDSFLQTQLMPYPLIENQYEHSRTFTLQPELAKKLFVRKDTIHGSISSFEQYAKCHYAYFLRYGLRLKQPVDTQFNEAKAGTLLHYIMETLVQSKQGGYTKTSRHECVALLQSKIEEYKLIYPNKNAYLDQLGARLIDTIVLNLQILDEQEATNHLNEHMVEHKFLHTLPFEEFTIQLTGYIDRIDFNSDFFRVIDYKSSSKSLQESDVFTGLQLQLMTYLLVMEDVLKKRPLGAFYYSLHTPYTNMQYAKVKKRPVALQLYKTEDKKLQFMKSKKLDGWICDEHIEVLDDSGTMIKGMSMTKSKGLGAKTIYNFEQLKSYLIEIYEQLSNSMIQGDIDCIPSDFACTYCPYGSLCLQTNQYRKKAELIEISENLYLKGGR